MILKRENKDNILLIDKPKGMTSFDVIRGLRKKLDVKKMGHAGTLDPLASGLLIIGINEGTKKMAEMLGLSKVYRTEVLLGVETDTGDMEGKVLKDKNVLYLSEDEVEAAIVSLKGELELHVPAYSAIKLSGRPLYWYARRGESVVLPIKKMKIHKITYLGMRKEGEHMIATVEMFVGSGTYVRSVAEELGQRLGVPATVYELRRTSVGDFSIDDAKKIEDFG